MKLPVAQDDVKRGLRFFPHLHYQCFQPGDYCRSHILSCEVGSLPLKSAASFIQGTYLFETYGIYKLKQLQHLSQQKDRPFLEVFGIGLQELEAAWLERLRAPGKSSTSNVSTAANLFERNPATACSEAQQRVAGKK